MWWAESLAGSRSEMKGTVSILLLTALLSSSLAAERPLPPGMKPGEPEVVYMVHSARCYVAREMECSPVAGLSQRCIVEKGSELVLLEVHWSAKRADRGDIPSPKVRLTAPRSKGKIVRIRDYGYSSKMRVGAQGRPWRQHSDRRVYAETSQYVYLATEAPREFGLEVAGQTFQLSAAPPPPHKSPRWTELDIPESPRNTPARLVQLTVAEASLPALPIRSKTFHYRQFCWRNEIDVESGQILFLRLLVSRKDDPTTYTMGGNNLVSSRKITVSDGRATYHAVGHFTYLPAADEREGIVPMSPTKAVGATVASDGTAWKPAELALYFIIPMDSAALTVRYGDAPGVPIRLPSAARKETNRQQTRGIARRLDTIVLPRIDLADMPLDFALLALRHQFKQRDSTGKGLNIVVDSPRDEEPGLERPVTLKGEQLSARALLESLGQQASLSMVIDAHAVILTPRAVDLSKLELPTLRKNVLLAQVRERLQTTVVPQLEFENMPVNVALAVLTRRSKELDVDRLGVDFALDLRAPASTLPSISMAVSQAPLEAILKYVCLLTDTVYMVADNGVVITDHSDAEVAPGGRILPHHK